MAAVATTPMTEAQEVFLDAAHDAAVSASRVPFIKPDAATTGTIRSPYPEMEKMMVDANNTFHDKHPGIPSCIDVLVKAQETVDRRERGASAEIRAPKNRQIVRFPTGETFTLNITNASGEVVKTITGIPAHIFRESSAFFEASVQDEEEDEDAAADLMEVPKDKLEVLRKNGFTIKVVNCSSGAKDLWETFGQISDFDDKFLRSVFKYMEDVYAENLIFPIPRTACETGNNLPTLDPISAKFFGLEGETVDFDKMDLEKVAQIILFSHHLSILPLQFVASAAMGLILKKGAETPVMRQLGLRAVKPTEADLNLLEDSVNAGFNIKFPPKIFTPGKPTTGGLMVLMNLLEVKKQELVFKEVHMAPENEKKLDEMVRRVLCDRFKIRCAIIKDPVPETKEPEAAAAAAAATVPKADTKVVSDDEEEDAKMESA